MTFRKSYSVGSTFFLIFVIGNELTNINFIIHSNEFHMDNNHNQELLFGVNNYNQNFPAFSDSLANQLISILNIKYQPLYLNKELLKEVDSVMVTSYSLEFALNHFLEIIALFGEVCNNELGTSWKMILADDSQTWNPLLIYNGQSITFHVYIYEDFFESYYNGSSPLLNLYNTINDIINMNIKNIDSLK